MMKRNQGITLIALVVTIIVLLILAGITISYVMGDNSIFKYSKEAKLKTDIASWQERLELAKNPIIVDGLGTIDKDAYFEYIEKQKYIENKNTDVVDNENGTYEITTKPGYVFLIELIPTKENPKDIKIEYIGEKSKLAPEIRNIEVISKSSNNITVKVTVDRLNDGKLSYYYQKEEETEYHELEGKQNTTDLTADFTGLEQNKIYHIKVVAKNKLGTAEKVVNEITGKLEVGVIRQKGETVWKNHKASIELETTDENLTLKYQIGGIDENSWIEYREAIENLDHKDKVYAVLTDGVNYGEAVSIEIRDGEAPTVTVIKETVTTNSITVTVSSTDAEWGMPTNPTYSYFIKESIDIDYSATAFYTGSNTSCTFTGLMQNTNYDIKVTTEDKAENKGIGTLANIKTKTVGGASESLQTGNIVASSPIWSGGKARITLSTTTGLQIQWQRGGISGTWTTGTSVTGLNHNDTVYARLWDGTNGGSEASVTVKDSGMPSATISQVPSSVYTEENITATVTHQDDESGVKITSCKWIFTTSSTKIGTTASRYTGTFSRNGQNITWSPTAAGSYYLHVLTVDNAGNKTETVSKSSVSVTVNQLATGVSVSPTSATIEKGKTKQLTATVTPSNTNNKSVTWSSSATGVATVSSNGLVTAKAAGTATITVKTSDGSNKTATCKITVTNPAPAVISSSSSSHTATTINYTWDQINKIAQAIANSSSVTSSTTEVTASIDGSSYKIGVGDIATVQYSGTNVRVRVLGFKHDNLVDTAVYGGNHTKASISFEFLDFMTGTTNKYMNSSDTNSGGWASTKMRSDLNGTGSTIGGLGANLSNKSYIKQVSKKYNATDNGTNNYRTCDDYLWLLSCSEIWSKGRSDTSGTAYGYAGGHEGDQYKWYKDNEKGIDPKNANSSFEKKPNSSSVSRSWWLRSPGYSGKAYFCLVNANGNSGVTGASGTYGVAPGFCI